MKYIIRADDKITYAFCESDTVKSVIQNCHLILTTRKGSVPMYRIFGIDMDFVDRPIPVAQTMMIAKVKEALEEFEPRAGFVNLTFEESTDKPGKIIPILEVEINEQLI